MEYAKSDPLRDRRSHDFRLVEASVCFGWSGKNERNS